MRQGRRAANILILLSATNAVLVSLLFSTVLGGSSLVIAVSGAVLLAGFVYTNVRPTSTAAPTRRIQQLSRGCELLNLFLITATLNTAWMMFWLPSAVRDANSGGFLAGILLIIWCISAALMVLLEAVLFWNGMIRVYLTSVQLGLKHRVIAALCGWVPFLNIWYLRKIIRIVSDEVEFETEKWELDETRAESEICKTKYPILMVHGVFFRDFRYLNYWGRIPKELKRNGAAVYYGQQQSAASVEDSGRELAARIRQKIAAAYNTALKKLGDTNPDFLAAVQDLTESACLERNKTMPDAPGVVYESVMSYCKKARHGRFPLNITYPVVRHFDGRNDGLVSVDSAKWGSAFTLLEPAGKRGISHGDVVDLNRENIPGFDVREFYVDLAAGLKTRGY